MVPLIAATYRITRPGNRTTVNVALGGTAEMGDELWMPKDLQVKTLAIHLHMADVRLRQDQVGQWIPAQFRGVATVLIGVDGAGEGIFKDLEVDDVSVEKVLTRLWDAARAAAV